MIQTPGWKTIILGGMVEDVGGAFEVGDGAGNFVNIKTRRRKNVTLCFYSLIFLIFPKSSFCIL